MTNDIYHIVMLVMLVAGLVLLLTPVTKAALGRDETMSSELSLIVKEEKS